MFLIRTTLLLGLGVLLLPTDEASQARVYSGAKSAMTWTMTFCDRNAETCAQGRQAWAVFLRKAEFGTKMAFDLISDRAKLAAEGPVPPPGKTPAHASATVPTGAATGPATPAAAPHDPAHRQRSTLKPGDMEPAWRGKIARVGG